MSIFRTRGWRTLSVFTLLASGLVVSAGAETATALSPDVVISQVYGGGGNSGATLTNDFVELFNRGSSPVSVTGWSVQYASSAGTSWQVTALSGTLQPGQYYLVQEAAGTGGTTPLPTPDATGSIPMSGSNGKVALVESTTALTGSCPAGTRDLVGYGTANCFEGAGAAPGLSNTTAAIRASGGCTETDENAADFATGAPSPRNTGSPLAPCTGPPADPVINEFVANHTGSDTEAFVEVFGAPSTDYSTFTVLEIEGDAPNQGVIDAVLPVTTTNGSGSWVDDEDMENGAITILLVEGFTGSAGTDLDTNDDGVFDSEPWTRIVDDIAVADNGALEQTYSTTVLAPGFGGSPFTPGGASRIPNGVDTDSATDWTLNDFDGFGFPGFAGSPAIGEAENTPGAINVAITIATDPIGLCNDPATLIHDIQGSGLSSPDVGSIREIEGIVTGDFEDGTQLNGFFMQEESADFDGDITTSEGIFVFNAGVGSVNTGDTVRVRGAVAEYFGLTEINNVASVTGCPATGTTAPAAWTLPVSTVGDWEWVEGMEITIAQTLHASGNFTQARYGEVDLSVDGPLDNPTNVVAPGAPAIALQDLNDRSRIQLDDASNIQNPLPLPPYLGLDNTLRTGDTLPGITGNVNYSFGVYQIEPTQTVSFTRVNARTSVPDVGGSIQVASANVLNYFTTIDDGTPICGPLSDQDCRGADSADELMRQRAKLVTEISGMDAEVIGLMEIENHPGDVPTADLVSGLNDATAPGTYDYVATGAIGSDAIRVALLYQPAAVTPLGSFDVLDSSDDPRFDDTLNRPMLVQTFVENATGATFTVAVNHLKSKGSDCNAVGDPDTGDGQGNCNITRTNAAQAIVDYLATDPTGSGSSDVLIIGDLNSYAKEDPIAAIKAGAYTDLIEALVGTGFADGAYSYNFFSQSGYLDHALASPSISGRVTGAAFWHVNSDEPSGLDYNDYNQPGLYQPDEFRSSDHDPVVIGLDLATARGLKETARADLAAMLPTGRWSNDRRIRKAISSIDRSLAPNRWLDDSYLNGKTGSKVFDNEKRAIRELMRVKGVAKPGAREAIGKLVAADDRLANAALDIAIATGGDRRDIAKATYQLKRAAYDIAHGRFDKAVDHYRRAWAYAIKAVDDARYATFNASLNRFNEGDLAAELASPGSPQPATIAEIIQRSRPEVLLINEFDYDAGGVSAALFQQNYLSIGQDGADPIEYPFRYVAPSNTGVPSGFDLNNDGTVGGADDAFGFGFFPGQYGMVVYSMHPIDVSKIRTFQNFLWKDMPGALLPELPPGTPWYSPDELDVFRLSSKSHWDVPMWIGDREVHFLVSHPTPPVFDGLEDRNGTRNFDEIRFWADYVKGGRSASYIYDDGGAMGGLKGGARFVIAGDQNSDPLDGDSIPGAVQQLLDNPKVNTKVTPDSLGGPEQAVLQGGANATHLSDPAFDTADFADTSPGNLRADYVLPSRNMKIDDAAVFWPLTSDPLFALVGTFPFPSSDHRLVWVDVDVH